MQPYSHAPIASPQDARPSFAKGNIWVVLGAVSMWTLWVTAVSLVIYKSLPWFFLGAILLYLWASGAKVNWPC